MDAADNRDEEDEEEEEEEEDEEDEEEDTLAYGEYTDRPRIEPGNILFEKNVSRKCSQHGFKNCAQEEGRVWTSLYERLQTLPSLDESL